MLFSKWIEVSRLPTRFAQGLRASSLARTLIAGLTAAVSGLFFTRLIGALVTVLIARSLGRVLYGEYSALVVTLSLFATLLGMGFDTWLLQQGGRDPDNLARYMREVLVIKMITAVALLAILAVVWSSQVSQELVLVIGALGVICDSFSQTGYSVLRVRRHNAQVALFQMMPPLLLLVTLLALQRSELSVPLIVSIQAACSLVVTLLVHWRIWPLRRISITGRIDPLEVVKKGWLFVASDGLSNTYSRAGQLILGATVSTAALGLLTPALNLIQMTYLIPNLLFVVGLPLLMAPDTSRREYWRVVRMMLAGSVVYGLAALVGLWFFGWLVIRALYGSQFEAALPLVKAMSLMPLFKALSFVWVSIMLAHLEQRLRVLLQAVTVIVSLPLNLLIIPVAGIEGAAWLYLGVEALLCVLYGLGAWWVTRRDRR